MKRPIIATGVLALLFSIAAFGFNPIGIEPDEVDAVTCGGERYIVFYEDANYGSNPSLTVCYPNNITNLYNVVHASPSHGCKESVVSLYNSWGQCISSFRLYSFPDDPRYMVCLFDWTDLGPGGGVMRKYLNSSDEAGLSEEGWNDRISSLRWWTDTTLPYTCPG